MCKLKKGTLTPEGVKGHLILNLSNHYRFQTAGAAEAPLIRVRLYQSTLPGLTETPISPTTC